MLSVTSRSLPALLGLLAVGLVSVAGCGSDAKQGPLGDSDSPSPSQSSSGPAAPKVPAASNDEAGRRAFASWFLEAFGYAFATNDAAPITEHAATGSVTKCTTCTLFAQFLQGRKDKGLVVKPSEYHLEKIFTTAKGTTGTGSYTYTMITDRPAFADVTVAGDVKHRYPEDKAYPIDLSFRFHDGAYEITQWVAGKGHQ